jgi:hypothetical protein
MSAEAIPAVASRAARVAARVFMVFLRGDLVPYMYGTTYMYGPESRRSRAKMYVYRISSQDG